MLAARTDPRKNDDMQTNVIDAFVQDLEPAWQRQQCAALLEKTRELCPRLRESLKWGQPHFDGNGAVLKWFCAKAWINVYFYRGHALHDPTKMFEPTDNKRLRTIKLTEQHQLDAASFTALLQQAYTLDSIDVNLP